MRRTRIISGQQYIWPGLGYVATTPVGECLASIDSSEGIHRLKNCVGYQSPFMVECRVIDAIYLHAFMGRKYAPIIQISHFLTLTCFVIIGYSINVGILDPLFKQEARRMSKV